MEFVFAGVIGLAVLMILYAVIGLIVTKIFVKKFWDK